MGNRRSPRWKVADPCWLAHFGVNREGVSSVYAVVERGEKAVESGSRFLARVRPIIVRAEGASP